MKTIKELYEEICATPCDINEHLPTIYKYACECKRIVELGVWQGNSTRALLNSRPTMMLSCDKKVTPEAEELHSQARRENINFTLLEADDLTIEIPICDLLFIDTEHSHPQVYKELCLHAEKVRKYIIFHDTVSYGFMDNGLVIGIVQFLLGHPAWHIKEHFTNNNGLTIIERR